MATFLTIYKDPVKGGALNRLVRLTEALAARGHEVHYISTDRLPLSHHKQAQGHIFPFAGGGLLNYILFTVFLLPYVPYVCLRYRINTIYSFAPLYSFPALFAKPFVRLVTFVRGDWMEELRIKKRNVILRLAAYVIQSSAFMISDRIVTVTDDLADTVRQQLPSADIVRLYNDLPKIRAKRKRGGKFTFGYVGRLTARKNVDFLIEAFNEADLKKARLVIVGSGPEEERLRAIAGKNVDFLGWRDDTAPVLASIDLLVITSLYEGCPNSVLEAFAVGTPVIGMEARGTSEVLGSKTLLFSSKKELVEKMKQLSKRKGYSKVVRACKARAKTFKFDWDKKAVGLLAF